MKEIRIDITKQTVEELAFANEHGQLVFRFNNTMQLSEPAVWTRKMWHLGRSLPATLPY